jgi:tetratricopeptide (TPR) repeat protein
MNCQIAAIASLLLAAPLSLAQDKDPKLTPKERTASKLAAEAAESMKKAEWEKGIRLCDRALRLDPENVNARWMRGLGHLKTNDFDQAIADFTDAIKRDAKMAPSYRDRGLAYMETKQTDKAIADFSEYIKLRPEDANGYEERAIAYRAKGAKDKAEADEKKAKQLRDKSKPKKD